LFIGVVTAVLIAFHVVDAADFKAFQTFYAVVRMLFHAVLEPVLPFCL
jgi:hypothetical protein